MEKVDLRARRFAADRVDLPGRAIEGHPGESGFGADFRRIPADVRRWRESQVEAGVRQQTASVVDADFAPASGEGRREVRRVKTGEAALVVAGDYQTKAGSGFSPAGPGEIEVRDVSDVAPFLSVVHSSLHSPLTGRRRGLLPPQRFARPGEFGHARITRLTREAPSSPGQSRSARTSCCRDRGSTRHRRQTGTRTRPV